MPTISVVIPLYNAEKTIQLTLDSVFQQTFADFELIIIDDGSTDGSLEIVKACQDPRLRLFSFENAGAAAARNQGIARAQGDYVALLDADDVWTPTKLADQLAIFREHPETGLVYSWSDYIDEMGEPVCPGKRVITSNDSEATYGKLLVSNFLENGSTPLIPLKVLREVGGFDETLSSSQDLDLYLKIAAHHSFAAVPKVQVYYRITPGSITSKIARNEQKELEFIDRLFANVPGKFQHLKRQKLSNLYRYLMLRSVEDGGTLGDSFRALRYLGCHVFYTPSILLQQWKFLMVMVSKMLLGSVARIGGNPVANR
ncbi:glycosyltransferase family 2 protein [Leptothoe kymatousa]|uniref:Glycosyltransferase n=1 Tax=Leptothoe kymatousa TAU-MAC 1615 TaxID=2364775 RepID=A0ABS5Y114_9CYAN|nr:glycosyltransferase [Leptothoe kymatousa]MBT9311507.1 glycosyltransferase [Leptothoe kymatousa TAU-MAC 1615]